MLLISLCLWGVMRIVFVVVLVAFGFVLCSNAQPMAYKYGVSHLPIDE